MKIFAALLVSFLLAPFFIFETQAQDTTYWWNDAVFYEAFVRSFYDSDGDGIGDFNGLTAKLDYIQSLGVNAVWLMPVCPSPSYHGYDITNYKALNPQYGTQQDYINFVNAAHSRGMKVIFDMVANHTSNLHPWFQQSSANDTFYRSFYRWSTTKPNYNGPWGEQVWDPLGNSYNDYYYGVFTSSLPDLNYNNVSVKDSMLSVVDFWIDSMHLDGFRCDAAPYIIEDGDTLENTPETVQFWKDFHSRYVAGNPNAMAVGEVWEDDNAIQQFTGNGGLDFCFEFNLQAAIIGAVSSSNVQGLVSEMNYINTNLPFAQYGTFISNHDENRSYDQLGDNFYKAEAAASIYLTLPGVPFIYYGEEVGMEGSGADQYKRKPMQWTNGVNAGFTSGTPWEALNTNYANYNVATEQTDTNSLLSWYKRLIALRHTYPILRRGTYYSAGSSNDAVFAFIRSYQGQSALVVVNTGSGAFINQSIGFLGSAVSNGTKYVTELLSDTSFIADVSRQVLPGISVGPYGTAIYLLTDTVISSGVGELNAGSLSLNIYPNPNNGQMEIDFNQKVTGPAGLTILNTLGQVVYEIKLAECTGHCIGQLNLQTQPAGLYFVYLKTENGVAVQKVFIDK